MPRLDIDDAVVVFLCLNRTLNLRRLKDFGLQAVDPLSYRIVLDARFFSRLVRNSLLQNWLRGGGIGTQIFTYVDRSFVVTAVTSNFLHVDLSGVRLAMLLATNLLELLALVPAEVAIAGRSRVRFHLFIVKHDVARHFLTL